MLVCVLAGLLYQQRGIRRDARLYPPPGKLIDIGQSRLHVFATGSGSPAVILESGISATTLNWRRVQTAVAEFTTVVSYERAGLGWSDPCCTPRTPSQIVEELRSMLDRAGISPPYILVGHSFGGLVVRSFALRYPADVVGVILVDALRPEEWNPLTARQAAMLDRGVRLSRRGALLARAGIVRLCISAAVAGSRRIPQMVGRAASGKGISVINRIAGEVRKMPEEVWPLIAAHWSDPKSFLGMEAHLRALPESLSEMTNAKPISNTPVIVLTSGRETSPLPLDVSRIGSNVKQFVAENSGHWIQLDEPELVISAIRELVETVRTSSQRHS